MQTEPIRLLLADDHPVVRAGYRRLIEMQPGYCVTAEADSASAAYLAYRRAPTDLVIIDLTMPGSSGLEAIRRIKAVDRKVLKARVIECVFEDWKGGRYKIISFHAKRARGLMARFAVENRLDRP